MTDDQFNTLIAAIISVGQANAWVQWGVIISGALFVATVLYVISTFWLLSATNKSIKLVRDNIYQQRIIEISHQWNSPEFVLARNFGSSLIAEAVKEKRLEGLHGNLTKGARSKLEDWVQISLVTHFFVRLHTLVETNQVEHEKVGLEFSEQIRHWCQNLKTIYDGFDKDEVRVSNALQALIDRYKDFETPGAESPRRCWFSIHRHA